jgi:hypothetical protein
MNNLYAESFEVLSQFPEGLTIFEFLDLLDEPGRKNASSRLSQFVEEGLAEISGKRTNPATGQSCNVYTPTGKPLEARQRRRQRHDVPVRKPSPRKINALRDELLDLRAWKAWAISLHPDLAIDPFTLKARAAVAGYLREVGNIGRAIMVEHGELDDSDTVKAMAFQLRSQS